MITNKLKCVNGNSAARAFRHIVVSIYLGSIESVSTLCQETTRLSPLEVLTILKIKDTILVNGLYVVVIFVTYIMYICRERDN